MSVFARASGLVRERPVLATTMAGALGVALGGLVFTGFARLVFVAVAGYVANELWRREGHIDIDTLVASLTDEIQDAGVPAP